MGRKQFFIESKTKLRDGTKCDKCGEVLGDEHYWNPNPRASKKNICEGCYDKWLQRREEGYQRWRETTIDHEYQQIVRGA